MIMVVAAFSIVSTLVMMIMEKSSDIAILKAMGAQDGSIERIFALEGTLIGVVGTALGVVAGISVTAQIEWIQRQIETIVGIDTLPASVYQFSTVRRRPDRDRGRRRDGAGARRHRAAESPGVASRSRGVAPL
jgi:lipoprotein-releasing system permease protein